MSKKNVRDKVIKDQLGSAMKLRIVTREALWGIVEAVVQLNPVESEEYDPEMESQKQFTLNDMQNFGIIAEDLPPIEFGSNKANNKRKKQQKAKQNKKSKVYSANNLPVFPYDGQMMEHNIYNLNKSVENNKQYVRILGNSSKPHTSLVQVLNEPENILEVHRFSGELVELSASEAASISVLVEEDITLRFQRGCPEGVHLKYWDQRYMFLSKYDEGAILDAESWYSITAEPIARYITQRCIQEHLAKSKKLTAPNSTWTPKSVTVQSLYEEATESNTVHVESTNAADNGNTMSENTTPDNTNTNVSVAETTPPNTAASHGISVANILDCFSGCGGNSIPFAVNKRVERVVSVDFDQVKLDNLRHNAVIYNNCDTKIHTICADVYTYLESHLTGAQLETLQTKLEKYYEKHPKNTIVPLKGVSGGSEKKVVKKGHKRFDDAEEKEKDNEQVEEKETVNTTSNEVTSTPLNTNIIAHQKRDFSQHVKIDHDHTASPDLIVMSPPWGGVDYCNNNVTFDLSTMLPCGDGIYLALLATTVCPNLVYLLPKNVDDAQIFALQKAVNKPLFVENIYLNGGCKVKCVYFGPLFKK